tara:strand:- start:241 stop:804 length:564 start_codon:yes stop_codon:yes gene_type:complete
MVWKHNGNEIRVGSSWTDKNGFKHPTNWASLWSDKDKKKWGLTWTDDVAPHDNTFYLGRKADGSLIERPLDDEDATDESGNKKKDKNGNQVINYGLKTTWINITKQRANNLLSKSDWEVTRKAEKGTAMASATSTFRDKVRTACNDIETKINNCSKFTEFKSLFDCPVDSKGNVSGPAPIDDFPEEI